MLLALGWMWSSRSRSRGRWRRWQRRNSYLGSSGGCRGSPRLCRREFPVRPQPPGRRVAARGARPAARLRRLQRAAREPRRRADHSSTRIRAQLAAGDIEAANHCLDTRISPREWVVPAGGWAARSATPRLTSKGRGSETMPWCVCDERHRPQVARVHPAVANYGLRPTVEQASRRGSKRTCWGRARSARATPLRHRVASVPPA